MSREVHVRFCESVGVRFPRATRLVVTVKGRKAHAEAIREQCRMFQEGKLKLTLHMEKTHVTHVNDGFFFLIRRIIRNRGRTGRMSGGGDDNTHEKAKAFAHPRQIWWIVSTGSLLAGRPSISSPTIQHAPSRIDRVCSGALAGSKIPVYQTIDAKAVSGS